MSLSACLRSSKEEATALSQASLIYSPSERTSKYHAHPLKRSSEPTHTRKHGRWKCARPTRPEVSVARAQRPGRRVGRTHWLLRLLLHHLRAPNGNLHVSALPRGSEDKKRRKKKNAYCLHQHKLPFRAVSQRPDTHRHTHTPLHKGTDYRRKEPFLNDTSHYPDFSFFCFFFSNCQAFLKSGLAKKEKRV